MKSLIAGISLFLLSGCAGTMFDGRLCSFATDAEAQAYTAQIVKQLSNEKDKEKVELGLKAAKLGATALCEAVRAKEAVAK